MYEIHVENSAEKDFGIAIPSGKKNTR